MPKSPRRPCMKMGCPGRAIDKSVYCATHYAARWKNRPPDTRPSSTARGYDRRWQRARMMKLHRDPLCERCKEIGLTIPAVVVHHIMPLADGGDHAMSNLKSECMACHNLEIAREKKERRERERDG